MATEGSRPRSPAPLFPAPIWLLALVVAVFTFSNALVRLQLTPLGAPPDEWAHLTHVDEVATGGHLLPDYAHSRILPAREHPNYLGHPPLYYTALGLAGRATGWDPVQQSHLYRGLSAAMVAAGMFLWILFGSCIRLPPLLLLVGAAAANALPMFGYLAGSINNDNLAYATVAIGLLGCALLATPGSAPQHRLATYLIALGVTATLLTKATAAVFILAFLAFWTIAGRNALRPHLHWRHVLIAALLSVFLLGAYYLPTLATYGTPFPRLATVAGKLPPPTDPAGTLRIAGEFARQMWERLPAVTSHASLQPFSGVAGNALRSLLALPLLAWALSRPTAPPTPGRHIGDAFFFAIAATLLVHFAAVWQTYHAHGVFAGLQPRYYAYVLPGVFVLGFQRLREHAGVRTLFTPFALLVAALLALSPSRTTQAQLARDRVLAPEQLRLPLVAATTGVRLVVIPRNAGFVDVVRSQGPDALRVSGWAISAPEKIPAPRVWVLLGDRAIGTASTGRPRPDVAAALDSSAAGEAGFDFVIHGKGLAPPACELKVAAEQSDGTLAPLVRQACRAGGDSR